MQLVLVIVLLLDFFSCLACFATRNKLELIYQLSLDIYLDFSEREALRELMLLLNEDKIIEREFLRSRIRRKDLEAVRKKESPKKRPKIDGYESDESQIVYYDHSESSICSAECQYQDRSASECSFNSIDSDCVFENENLDDGVLLEEFFTPELWTPSRFLSGFEK